MRQIKSPVLNPVEVGGGPGVVEEADCAQCSDPPHLENGALKNSVRIGAGVGTPLYLSFLHFIQSFVETCAIRDRIWEGVYIP